MKRTSLKEKQKEIKSLSRMFLEGGGGHLGGAESWDCPSCKGTQGRRTRLNRTV